MKKILAYMLAFVMVLSCFAGIELTAKAEGENVLSVGQTFDVEPTDDISATYQFTPDEDGTYIMYSYNLNPGYMNLSSTENWLSNSWWEDEINLLSYDLIAGETYTYDIVNGGEEAASLTLIKAEKATEIAFAEDTIEGWIGDYPCFEVTFGPMFCITESYSFASDNEEVVFVDEYGEVQYVGVGTATVTVTSENGLTDTCTVTVKEPAVIELDQVVTVENAKPGSKAVFYFTPSETGSYAFCSDTDLDVYAYIYSIDGSYIADNDDCQMDLNFQVKAELEAGVTYLLEAYLYDSESAGNYDVYITMLKQPTEMSFIDDKLAGYIGSSLGTMVQFGPGLVADEDFDVTSSDDSIVGVSKDEYGNVYFNPLTEGTATITATSESDLSCTCEVTVLVPESVSLDEAKTVDLLEGQNTVKFVFTPDETAEYVFYSTDGSDAYVELSQESYGWLASNSGDGNGDNFKVAYELQQGETYFYVCNMPNDAESLSVVLKKATEATELTMEYSEMTLYVENSASLDVNVQPENGVTNVTFESSDTDVVKVQYVEGTHAFLVAKAEGTATVTATSENGLTATCKITVLPIPEIKVNDVKNINIEEAYQTGSYIFTPEEDGKYVLKTKGAEDIVFLVIFDEDQSDVFEYETGEEDDFNATIEVELKAGVKYYIHTGYDDGEGTGSYELLFYNAANPPVDTPDNIPDKDNTTSGGATNNNKTPSPQTGDSQVTWIWIVLMTVAVLGVLVVVITRKKNK